jgi:hypothetical protein
MDRKGFTMQKSSVAISLAAALALSTGPASAQEKVDGQTVKQVQKEDSVPPSTGRTLPEQGGKTEPGAKVEGTNANQNVLVNGVLSAQGASTDVDTAPAKYSGRNDADDRVPIAGYRLKHLNSDQRNEIIQGLGSQREAPAAGDNDGYATIGAEIPSTVAVAKLTPMPESLASKFPGLRGTGFMRTAGKVLVVDLDNSRVVGVL